MAGAADLLIEESILGEVLDIVVGADCQLADPLRAVIGFQHRLEVIEILVGGEIGYQTIFESQLDILDFATTIAGRVAVGDMSVGAVFNRSGENLTIREILLPVAVDPLAAFNRQLEVGAFTLNVNR